jgi:hypothetical protein
MFRMTCICQIKHACDIDHNTVAALEGAETGFVLKIVIVIEDQTCPSRAASSLEGQSMFFCYNCVLNQTWEVYTFTCV